MIHKYYDKSKNYRSKLVQIAVVYALRWQYCRDKTTYSIINNYNSKNYSYKTVAIIQNCCDKYDHGTCMYYTHTHTHTHTFKYMSGSRACSA